MPPLHLPVVASAVAVVLALATAPAAVAHVVPAQPGGVLEELGSPAFSPRVTVPAAAPGMAPSWCPSDPGRTTDDTEHAVTNLPDVKVVYAYPTDRPNRFAYFATEIQRAMAAINTLVSTAQGSTGQQSRKAVRFDMGTACGPEYVDIQTVALDHASTEYSASELFLTLEVSQELRDKKATGVKADRRTIVYLDGLGTGAAGYAGTPGDSQPGQQNYLNSGEQTAWVFGYNNQVGCTAAWPGCATFQNRGEDYFLVHAPLHELFHTLGAVGPKARHASSPIGHCTDEFDVLCGQSSGLTFPCGPDTENLVLDCGKDDYFNPEATITDAGGEQIWNVYDSRFLCVAGRCGSAPPTARIEASTTTPRVGDAVVLSARASSDDTAIAGFRWDLDGDGTFERSTGTVPEVSLTPAAAGRLRVGVEVTDEDALARSAATDLDVLAVPGATAGPGPQPVTPGAAAAKAKVLSLSLKPKRLRAGSRSRGTLIRFRLDEAAPVRFTVERRRAGRKRGWTKLAGSFSRPGVRGVNRLRFRGRLRGRALRPGTYRLVAVASAGTAPVRATFTITRRG